MSGDATLIAHDKPDIIHRSSPTTQVDGRISNFLPRGFSALNWMPGPGPGWPSRMLPCDTHLPGALASPSWMPHEMPTTWQVDGACPSAVTQTAVPATTGYRSHICICMPGPLATDICSAAAAEEHRVRPPTWMAKFNFTFAEAFLAPVFL